MIREEFRQESLFSGKVAWKLSPVTDRCKQKNGFVFPGQGAMFPGMGRDFENSPHFRKYFAWADGLATDFGLPKPSEYCFSPNRLTLEELETIEALALFTFSVAMAFELSGQGIRPQAVTGHSFGEYAALVVSGILDFGTGYRLVMNRERVLAERNKLGFMLAVNASPSSLHELLGKGPFFISNINSQSQTVLSASWDSIVDIEKQLSRKQIRFKRLMSPQPFHSVLLQQLTKGLSLPDNRTFSITEARIPFFSSVVKRWVVSENEVHEYLSQIIQNQLVEPVDFETQIKSLSAVCSNLIEVGPKPLLISLIKENSSSQQTSVFWSEDMLDKVNPSRPQSNTIDRTQVKDSTLKRINSVIARLTGYELNQIKFEDRFQEDLGIDSIKTMEISVEIINEFKLPQASLGPSPFIRTVGELAYQVDRQEKDLELQSITQKNQEHEFTVFDMEFNECNPLDAGQSEHIEPKEVIYLRPGADLSLDRELEKHPTSTNLIFDCSLVPDHLISIEFLQNTLVGFFDKMNRLIDLQILRKETRILVVSTKKDSFFSNMVTSFFKSLKKEGELSFVSQVIFDTPEDFNRTLIERECLYRDDLLIRYQQGKRLVGKLKEKNGTKGPIPDAGVVVVVGGGKGIGRTLTDQLFKDSQWKVHVLGRSPSTDLALPSSIFYHRVDACDLKAMEHVFKKITKTHGPINVLINSVGIENSRSFRTKSIAEIEQEFLGKALPSFVCSYLSDKFSVNNSILFSSVIEWFGNIGQTVYGSTNALSKSFWEKNASPQTRRIVMEWPPWKNTGMTAKPLVRDVLERSGVSLLPPDQGKAHFEKLVSKGGGILLPRQDLPLYEGPLVWIDSLCHLNPTVFPYQGGLTYQFEISLEDYPELLDHQFESQPLLPMALTATWFSEILRKVYGQNYRLDELQILRPTILKKGNISLNIQLKDLNISLKNADKIVAQGRFYLDSGTKEEILRKGHDMASVFQSKDIYKKGGLFHGPEFQILDAVEINSLGKAVGKSHLEKIKKIHSHKFSLFFWALESALQTAAVTGCKLQNWRGLPVVISGVELKVDRLHDSNWTWEITSSNVQDNRMSASLVLFNDDGKILGQVKELIFQK